jgi:hypothetical protein
MSRRTRTVLFVVLGVAVLMATIHFTINGLPSLSSLNPHRH